MATSSRREAELFRTVVCSAAEDVRDFVYFPAADTVRKVDIDDPAKMWAVAIVVQKLGITTCVVQLSGVVAGLHSGLVMGKPVYADINAVASQALSYPATGVRFNQVVGIPTSPTDLKLEFQTPIGLVPL